VASPTFVIASEYPLPGEVGRRLVHVDCYRLERIEELENAGWLDWLVPGSVVAVEWPDRIEGVLPPDHLRIEIARDGAGDSQRWLNAIASGPGAEALLARWRAAVERSPDLEPEAIAPAS
jgi:tRNA threonylcarbamoyladenosine biosynthesis protein TsaE